MSRTAFIPPFAAYAAARARYDKKERETKERRVRVSVAGSHAAPKHVAAMLRHVAQACGAALQPRAREGYGNASLSLVAAFSEPINEHTRRHNVTSNYAHVCHVGMRHERGRHMRECGEIACRQVAFTPRCRCCAIRAHSVVTRM